jgi:hypothetical protein
MSQLKKRFETKASAMEMKHYINTKLLPNPVLKPFLDTAKWNENILYITSKLGTGTITLLDNIIEVNIELTFFGSMAKNTLESTLDSEFKKLNP